MTERTLKSKDQLQLRRRMDRNRQALYVSAGHADKAQSRIKEKEQELQRLTDANRETTEADFQQATTHTILAVSLLAVYVIDFLMFGPVAEFFADRNFAGWPVFIVAARILLPAAILILELCFSTQSYLAQEAKLDGWQSASVYWFWTIVAAVFAIVMPAAVIATFLVTDAPFSPWVSGSLLIMLAALSLGGHLAVLFGRQQVLEALSFIAFRRRKSRLERQLRQFRDQLRRLSPMIAEPFREYEADLQNYNARYPDSIIHPKPFDALTYNVLIRVFGKEETKRLDGAAVIDAAGQASATATGRTRTY